ncbi:Nmd5p KNAG_0B06750 [Huiozyma naganishii CBS 8797]|uniref:Importin N-terminal domain-containing protein n=1 Tax=Huiozyma naganishii (strain ATCC MYA-139 / BCRC 22969 / CBS 8797 / KCTC 17520 / NBRC 10181 / NCYC 3082 / Yp74L-3) TaxID=1071383 RepID=J7R2Q3_HUIN7|nr:hypothetical protein KNAG_0B06750 [Kazachstania naganishii CBS 8797]CCK69100.1 hypothetical protein KNAG_0B06750 [Kazachstania naganishii CBS 8797]
MDVSMLLECFSGTLEFDANVRNAAESQLKQASKSPGFLGACLSIISSNEVSENIKLAASLYFKNEIRNGWTSPIADLSSRQSEKAHEIDIDERPIVKDMLIETMVHVSKKSPHCIKVLKSALETIISSDYSKGLWNELLPKSVQLISTGDLDVAHVGLICLSELFRTYRWKENDGRQELEKLIIDYFPSLLVYANDVLCKDGENVNEPKAGEALKLILKIYKFVTYNDLPFVLQRDEYLIPWANLFVKIIQLPLTEQILSKDVDVRRTYSWVKCKKWAYANLYRLFQRYASTSLSRKFEYGGFKKVYVEHFLPNFLQLIFNQIEQWGARLLWLSDESLYYIQSFLEQCISQKPTWPLVKPHYETILEHVVFPLLRLNEDTLNTFVNDPQEYIHRNLELWDNDYSPDLAAVSLLITAVNKRGKTTLAPTLKLIVGILQKNQSNDIQLNNACNIESALKMLSCIIDKLTDKNSPFASDLEGTLVSFVLPFFDTPYGFLKCRICDIISKLGDIDFKSPTLLPQIYEGILQCLNDSSDTYLPINLSAALALQTFIQDPSFKEALKPSVVPIMQKLLSMSNEFESDSISGVMQDFVEEFSEELQPFGTELVNSLVQQFMKLAVDLNEASNFDPNTLSSSEAVPDETEKHMAALGVLSTIISILLSFENSLEIVKNLEQSFYPAAEFILKTEMEDFYRELSEFFENSTFLLRFISPITWKILELVGDCNKRSGMIGFYLDDFLPMLNNILVYGAAELRQSDLHSQILFEIYQASEINSESSLDELNTKFDLSQKMMIALGTPLSGEVQTQFLTDCLGVIEAERGTLKKSIVFGVTSFNVVIAGFIINPALALGTLNKFILLEMFFETWLTSYAPNYTRTYDIKLSIMAILSLFTNLPLVALNNAGLSGIISKLGDGLANLLVKFPMAERDLMLKRVQFTQTEAYNETTIWDDEDGEDEEAEGELDFEGDQDDIAKYLSSNNDGAIEFVNNFSFEGGESFDDLEEDPLTKSVIDDVNVYSEVKNSILQLQQSDAEKYQLAFGGLNKDQQQLLLQTVQRQ